MGNDSSTKSEDHCCYPSCFKKKLELKLSTAVNLNNLSSFVLYAWTKQHEIALLELCKENYIPYDIGNIIVQYISILFEFHERDEHALVRNYRVTNSYMFIHEYEKLKFCPHFIVFNF